MGIRGCRWLSIPVSPGDFPTPRTSPLALIDIHRRRLREAENPSGFSGRGGHGLPPLGTVSLGIALIDSQTSLDPSRTGLL
jgi:hypothetical protein